MLNLDISSDESGGHGAARHRARCRDGQVQTAASRRAVRWRRPPVGQFAAVSLCWAGRRRQDAAAGGAASTGWPGSAAERRATVGGAGAATAGGASSAAPGMAVAISGDGDGDVDGWF
jgi:hypothetical protein